MKRAVALVAVCAFVVSCGGFDQKKFDAVHTAGKALQAEVQSGGRQPGPKSRERLKEFETAIAALEGHTIGIHEADALHSYTEAADAYRTFLRFQSTDPEEGTALILLKGPNLEAATRFKLPIDTRSGAKYVNRGQAITILLQAGEQHVSDGNRIAGIP